MKEVKRKRNIWTKEEDLKLKFLVEERKIKNWVIIASFFSSRSNKDCRDHYIFQLSPNVVKRKWTIEEEHLLLEKFNEYGPKWVKLTSFFDKRSPHDLKNRVKLIHQRKSPLRSYALNLQKQILNERKNYFDSSVNVNESKKTNISEIPLYDFNINNPISTFSNQNLFHDFPQKNDETYCFYDGDSKEYKIDDIQSLFNYDSFSFNENDQIGIF